ncbi:MAG: site-2 protease family protein [Candidatus Handelsmanbacteria bacterium]|nr:site-2 protease family protein [Candidatus Handelsmanbacteria bacterium]
MNLWRKTPAPLPPPPLAIWEPLPSEYFHPPAPSRDRPLLHLALFALTLFSMTAAGAMQQGVDPLADLRSLVHLSEGIPFAVTLLGILTVHEFGHYFAARRWGLKVSFPYFLPMLHYLSLLGTLGAVIRLRSPIPHKRALLDIGAAGPLAGFVVALAACLVGLSQSALVEAGYFRPELQQAPIELGAPLLFSGLSALVLPTHGPEQMVLLSPVAFAGWVGLFITAFNLFPVGQLDGGHIVYALFRRRHRAIGHLAFGLLLGMGVYGVMALVWNWPQGWPGWLGLALFLALFGKGHPTPADPETPLDGRRRLVGYACLGVYILCFTPVPFSA